MMFQAMTSPTPARIVKYAVLLLVGWTVFALLSSAHFFFAEKQISSVGSFLRASDNILIFYWAWALLTPLVLYTAGRVARNAKLGVASGMMLLAAGIAATIVHGIIYISLLRLSGVDYSLHVDSIGLRSYLIRHAGGDLATFGVIVGVFLLVEANRRAAEREKAAAELSSRLSRADLELLKWNLHPHFLFNALNTVSTLILSGKNDRADRAVSLIAKYLRSALDRKPDQVIQLGDEIAAVQRYVEIEQLRFGDSMRVDVEIADNARTASVPGEVLQPIVENAIVHGGSRNGDSRPITIRAEVKGARLAVTVSNPDNVNGAKSVAADEHDGFGMRYVRERLRHFYGDDASCDLISRDGITSAVLDIPYVK
jgi:sensor histidine kinase YesM